MRGAFAIPVFVVLLLTNIVCATMPPMPPAPTRPSSPGCLPIGFLMVQPLAVFTSEQPIRITAVPTMINDCGHAPTVKWLLNDVWPAQGTTVSFAAGSVAPGRSYPCLVQLYSASTLLYQVNITVDILSSLPSIAIVGGDRSVEVQQPIAFLAHVSQAKRVVWSACNVNSFGECASSYNLGAASQMDTPFTSALLLTLGFIQEGDILLTAVAVGSTANASASVVVTASGLPAISVTLRSTSPSTTLVGVPVTFVAVASQPFSTFDWTATGLDVSRQHGPVATFIPTRAGVFTVTVSAKSIQGGLQGNATARFTVVSLPTGRCTVSSGNSTITGGVSTMSMQVAAWGGAKAGGFRYGFESKTGAISLSPDFLAFENFTFTAPLFAGATTVSFALQTTVEGSVVTVATCDALIKPPSDMQAALDSRATLLKSAVTGGDASLALRSALDLSQVLLGGASAQYNVTDLLAELTQRASLTSTQKGTLVDVLNLALTAMSPNADMQSSVVTILQQLLASGSADPIDINARAASLVALVDLLNPTKLNGTDATAKQSLAQKIAVAFASAVPLGDIMNITSDGISIAATKLPASQVGTPFNATGGVGFIAVPLGALGSALGMSAEAVALLNADVAVSAAVHEWNPVPAAEVPRGAALSGAIVEYDVTMSGANFSAGLTVAITVGIRAPANGTCVYFDAARNAWSTAGVTTAGYDVASGLLLCNTTHLSLFSGVNVYAPSIPSTSSVPRISSPQQSTAASTATTPAFTATQFAPFTSAAASSADGGSSLSTVHIAIIVGIVVVVVAVVAAVVTALCCRRRRQRASTSASGALQSSPTEPRKDTLYADNRTFELGPVKASAEDAGASAVVMGSPLPGHDADLAFSQV